MQVYLSCLSCSTLFTVRHVDAVLKKRCKGCNYLHALQIKAEGTQVLISTEYENQYSVNIPFVVSFYESQQRAYAQATQLSLSVELGNACV